MDYFIMSNKLSLSILWNSLKSIQCWPIEVLLYLTNYILLGITQFYKNGLLFSHICPQPPAAGDSWLWHIDFQTPVNPNSHKDYRKRGVLGPSAANLWVITWVWTQVGNETIVVIFWWFYCYESYMVKLNFSLVFVW